MRECRTYGSVRGAGGDARPYRDLPLVGSRAEGALAPTAVQAIALPRPRRVIAVRGVP